MVAGQPAAQAGAADGQRVSVAEQLSLTAAASVPGATEVTQRLADEAATRSERTAAAGAAAAAQAAADQAVRDEQARLAEEARKAEEARLAEEAGKAAEAAAAAAAAAATPASFKDYALQQLGGDASQFSCLQSLWGKESGWNPNAQNPTSTAYGIAQFLNSTWALTGFTKTSDGYRQIDAGLVYIDRVYGSPCEAWGHSQANNWY
ncbi:transglycosylase SLT domain-containing protein [Modestobacter sp. I12A-02628]|uniref:Transglycosylase SLT domain-containing protein n=2 Tax=Goekera deserti TaxID=2497753 RepID=A0A7K3WIX8_9ACTN|nr:transglycosylase SLT domain-containing protein [Goekera deserti]NDI46641.1 transglycosylase SLT domain-containing protein [Goekera deserti]NEL56397.1 transglycosylase SLT domain-containing protein [Goekera deserti]